MRKLFGLLFGAVLTAGAAAPALAQISDDVVKLGVLTDMTGLYSDATGKGSQLAAQMAVDDFGGKVRGKPVEVIGADHQNKPDVGAAIARSWFDKDKVDVILDVPTSSVALAVAQITRDKNKLLLISGGGSSELSNGACSPNTIQWTYDTYGQSNVAARALVARGEKSWFFLTADYAFGQAFERDASAIVRKLGGTVVGSVRHPLNTADFSSFLLRAQASNSQVVALANAGGDTSNAIKQAGEFGLSKGQKLLALLIEVTDVHSIGLQEGQGLILADSWYWDQDAETRAFSKRYYAKMGMMPTMIHAGVYSSVLQYLKAVDATGTDDSKTVIAKMTATPVNDMFAKNGLIRDDGRMVHDMYLRQVKTPAESKGEWDLLKTLATIPGDQAFRPLAESDCPLIKK
jgi:branched-chain amino acid transport system substrate-binding protein